MIRGAKRSQRCSMPMGAAMHAFFGIRRFQQAITLCAWRSPAPCDQSRHTLLAYNLALHPPQRLCLTVPPSSDQTHSSRPLGQPMHQRTQTG